MWKGKTQIRTLYHTFVSKVPICQSFRGKFITSFYSRRGSVTEPPSGWGWKGPPELILCWTSRGSSLPWLQLWLLAFCCLVPWHPQGDLKARPARRSYRLVQVNQPRREEYCRNCSFLGKGEKTTKKEHMPWLSLAKQKALRQGDNSRPKVQLCTPWRQWQEACIEVGKKKTLLEFKEMRSAHRGYENDQIGRHVCYELA